MRILSLALTLLRRDYKAGELHILVMALVIAVMAMTSLDFYTDRVMRAIEMQANELLAADRVISSSQALPEDWEQLAREQGLETAQVISFSSMSSAQDQFYLVDIRAVSEAYPLRGEIRYQDDIKALGIPAPGEIWVERRLLDLLNIAMGETVSIGDAMLKVSAVITHDPGLSGNWFKMAPYVLMNIADIAQTNVIQPGSRINYRLLLSDPRASQSQTSLDAFEALIKPQLLPGQEFLSVREARPVLQDAMARAQQYLNLASMISVILAGIAILMASRHYSFRHFDVSALLRCFGARRRQVLSIYMLQLFILGLFATAIGYLLGLLGHIIFEQIFAEVFAVDLPSLRFAAGIPGIIIGMIILLGFGVPPLLQLQDVPPLRVLQRGKAPTKLSSTLLYLSAAVSVLFIILWQTGDVRMTLYVFFGALFSFLLLLLLIYRLIRIVNSARLKVNVSWQYGIANLVRHSASHMIQILAFGLAIMVILILSFVRTDLLKAWSNQLPENTPNYFLLNIQDYQIQPLTEFFKQYQLKHVDLYPIIRGRLTELNGAPILEKLDEEVRETRALHRELNLSYVAELPPENQIVQGQWWPKELEPSAAVPISMEEKLAKRLKLQLGDRLGFSIGDRKIIGELTSLRSLRWDSFQPNFFVLFPPKALDDFPSSYLTSFYLPADQKEFLNTLLAEFPTMSVLDVGAILTQVRSIFDKVSIAIEFIFVFTIFAALVVLLAAVNATLDRRLYEGAILRTLGASTRTIRMGLAAEFIAIGFLAGLFAAIGATVISVILATQVFNLPASWHIELWFVGPLSGIILVGVSGLLATRRVVRQEPLRVLNNI